MGKKLTFKEYLESKETLIGAISTTPQCIKEYSTNKYCKLVVGQTKNEKEFISMKPNQTILVEWIYDDLKNPSISSIKFEDVKYVSSDKEYTTYWGGERLQKWLGKNTDEI